MRRRLNVFLKFLAVGLIYLTGTATFAQDGKMYPMDAPEETRAIPLGTGGVDNQPEKESWFRQWRERWPWFWFGKSRSHEQQVVRCLYPLA